MARQPDIQYVRFYTDGSAARKLELQPEKKKTRAPLPQRPRVRRASKTVVHIDPISMMATVVACVMLIAMAAGMLQLGSINGENQKLEGYISELRTENASLRAEYEAGYDLKDVEQKALEMGLVPIDQVEKVIIEMPQDVQEPDPGFWERVGSFFAELFGA